MRINWLLRLAIMLIILMPLAAAFTLNMDCNTRVRESEAVNCNLRLQLDSAAEEVQGLQFKINLPVGFAGGDPLITIPNTLSRSISVIWQSVNDNFVVLDTSGNGIADGTLLAILHFKAGSSGGTFAVREKVPDFRFSAGQVIVTDGDILPPPITPTCSDRQQNQGETGIDCGGPCAACIVAPCVTVVADCTRTGVNCPGNVPVGRVVCSGATPSCNDLTGQCEAAPTASCAENELISARGCVCDLPREVLRGICSGLIEEVRTSVEQGSSDLSIVSRIAAALRDFFARIFGSG